MNGDVRPGGDRSALTGTGQLLVNVHPSSACASQHCVVHNPSEHRMRDWPTHWRDDRRIMERICPHGVGHPDPDDAAYRAAGNLGDSVHGCDGCCVEARA